MTISLSVAASASRGDAGEHGGGAGGLARRGDGVHDRAEAVAARALGAAGDEDQLGALGVFEHAAARLDREAGGAQLLRDSGRAGRRRPRR